MEESEVRDFAVLVCGFPRCGSSLVMQMLAAGGLPCVGRYPAFEEPAHVYPGDLDAAWFSAQVGRAVKVLDPINARPPGGVRYRAIWLDRDLGEQTKSWSKFGQGVGLLDSPLARPARRALAASFVRDRPRSLRLLESLGAATYLLTFESILGHPERSAYAIDMHLGGGLDVAKMAAVPLKRDAACRPDMAIELALIAR